MLQRYLSAYDLEYVAGHNNKPMSKAYKGKQGVNMTAQFGRVRFYAALVAGITLMLAACGGGGGNPGPLARQP